MAARREILIDAYNVLYADRRLNALVRRDAERARDEFVALVALRLPPGGGLGVVVFDAMRDPRPVTETGRTRTSMQRGLQIVYARDSADTWIRDRIRAHPDPSLLTIVTSDREILETARVHGAGILRVADFLQLGKRQQARAQELRNREKPEHQSRGEIAEWERLFGERPEEE